MRLGDLIGDISHRRVRLDTRSGVRPKRFTVLGLEALEPRELLSVAPGQEPAVVNEIPFGVISVLAKAAVPAAITNPPPNFVNPVYGRIPMPVAPNAANANLVQPPLFGHPLGMEPGMGSGDIRPHNAAEAGNSPNPLLPQKKLTPPLPGQGAPPTPPPKPRIGFGSQASNNEAAASQTGESSGSAQDRIARDRAILRFVNPTDAAGTPAGPGDAAGNNARAHDQAIVSLVPEEAVQGAPVVPPANAKPGSEGTLANRPGTVR
jgi:hypothetical protein